MFSLVYDVLYYVFKYTDLERDRLLVDVLMIEPKNYP